MEREICINRVLRDMRLLGIIPEDNIGDARIYANAIWVASYEERTRELLAHNKKKVVQYNRGDQEIATFSSIAEAARANKCSRDVVDDSITGRVEISRKGYYFRYAEEDNDSNEGADAEVEGQETDSKGT